MSYDLMFQKAIELQNAGALQQAEEIYLKLLEVMPENTDVWNLLGLISQSKGDLARARDCFLTAIKYAKMPFFAHYFNLGLTYKGLKKNKEAIDSLLTSIRLKDDFKEGWNLLGILRAEENDKTEAAKCFCKALEIDESYEDARVNLCYYTNDLKQLFKLADDKKCGFWALFMAAQASEDLSQKERYLRRAVQVEPERSDALFLLADVLRQEEYLNESLTYYHKVLNLDKNNVYAFIGIGDILSAQNKFDEAESFYLKSFDINRDIVDAHLNYGTLLYRQGRVAEALNAYREAVRLAPEKPEISYNLALILKDLGDYEEALGLMFHAHLNDKENDIYSINLMETLNIYYHSNAEAALKIAQNWQQSEPDNVFSKRILAGISGVIDEQDNTQYASKLFDNFADSYETTMANINSNIIPYFKTLGLNLSGRILDLGCGTGLAAEALKTANNSFDGVDISQKMLDIARAKNIYDNLYLYDITEFLRNNKTDYDMILAFDVLCYMGDLAPIISTVKARQMWFTVEAGDEDENRLFYPTPSGRYKHKKKYVLDLIKKYHFKKVQVFDLTLRTEDGQEVSGYLFGICHQKA